MTREARLVAITEDPQIEHDLHSDSLHNRYSVKTVATTAQATDYLKHYATDLVLLDTPASIEAGAFNLGVIRQQWAVDSLPVIVLTATSDCDHLMHLMQAGANDFVLKPLSVGPLIERVDGALSMRASVFQLLEAERRRVMSESLAYASATTAAAMTRIVDKLEWLMKDAITRGTPADDGLSEVLARTEQVVDVIDHLRELSEMKDVPYTARRHLLMEFLAAHT